MYLVVEVQIQSVLSSSVPSHSICYVLCTLYNSRYEYILTILYSDTCCLCMANAKQHLAYLRRSTERCVIGGCHMSNTPLHRLVLNSTRLSAPTPTPTPLLNLWPPAVALLSFFDSQANSITSDSLCWFKTVSCPEERINFQSKTVDNRRV